MKLNPGLIVFSLGWLGFVIGLALVYLPAGLIGGGAVLMGISIFGGRKA